MFIMRGNMPIYRITNILLKNFPVSLAFPVIFFYFLQFINYRVHVTMATTSGLSVTQIHER